ncbi:MAG: PepSY domain-containing protein [Opitutaceae bacterium]|nr:PepSY domain-containing protein [Opitutaceae bacterium]
MSFRKVIFWIHLLAGVIAGISIFIMCLTGVALAFEKDIVAFAERDVRRVEVGDASTRQSLAELQKAVQAAQPEARPSAIVVSADPAAAVAFQLGRSGALYANPYTGEIRQPTTTRTHDFMHVMEDWHRVLALSGDNRPAGKAINGACNLAFFVLAVTGLYIWWPRKWRSKGLRRSLVFIKTDGGKARDWNWHNVIGFWSAPVLIVLTLTALPISYRWAGNLIYTLSGEEPPPVRSGTPVPAAPTVTIPAPPPGARPAGPDALLASAQAALPNWNEITLRLGGGRGPRGGETSQSAGPQPVAVSVKTPGTWPRTASTTLALNPFTAEVLQTDTFADLSPARRFRTWTRFLHTGEALGWPGQFVAGLASLGGCVLVYTGFALTWRRYRRWRSQRAV